MVVVSNVAVRFWLWWCIMQYICVLVYAGCAIELIRNGHVDIPKTWNNIPPESFNNCFQLLKSVTIPDNIKTIGAFAFCGTYLQSVTIPEGTIAIGRYAFANCLELQSLTISQNLRIVNEGAFGSYARDFNWKDKVLYEYTHKVNNLTEVYIPGGFPQTTHWDRLAFPATKFIYGSAPSIAPTIAPTIAPLLELSPSLSVASVVFMFILITIFLARRHFSATNIAARARQMLNDMHIARE